jgi:hypothetical protein
VDHSVAILALVGAPQIMRGPLAFVSENRLAEGFGLERQRRSTVAFNIGSVKPNSKTIDRFSKLKRLHSGRDGGNERFFELAEHN